MLNAPSHGRSTLAVSGTLRFPTVLVGYPNRAGAPAAVYDSLMYLTPPTWASYSLRMFYEEISHGRLTLRGQAIGWFAADSARSYYVDACGSDNAVFCAEGRARMRDAFFGALQQGDVDTDFGTFDNDGPDDVPNSGDDDGVVDAVQFVHPDVGGECGGRGFWAHQSGLSAIGGAAFETNDRRPDGSLTHW